MAADRLRIIVDEIHTTIKQTFDDQNITRAQVAYWVICVGNDLLSKHVGKRDSGQFLNIFPVVPIQIASQSSSIDIVKGRKYVELPKNIFDFDKDEGIEYIAYSYDEDPECQPEFTRKVITRTSPEKAAWLYQNEYTKPSPKNPYWYRVNNLIYFLGIEKVPIDNVEMGLFMTIDPLEKVDFDAPFRFPQELMPTLRRFVIEMARYSFFFPQDRKNEGNDEGSPGAQIPKIVSVNDQNNAQ